MCLGCSFKPDLVQPMQWNRPLGKIHRVRKHVPILCYVESRSTTRLLASLIVSSARSVTGLRTVAALRALGFEACLLREGMSYTERRSLDALGRENL